jgi:hypothetical protein
VPLHQLQPRRERPEVFLVVQLQVKMQLCSFQCCVSFVSYASLVLEYSYCLEIPVADFRMCLVLLEEQLNDTHFIFPVEICLS